MRNDRWSTIPEIKKALVRETKEGTGGPILYHGNGQNWIHDKEGHMIFLGVSGSGKSRRGTIPMIKSFIRAEESFVVVDPKGEIHYQTAYAASRNHDVHVIDFRHIFESERWNPMAAPCELFKSGDEVNKQIAIEMVDELASALYHPEQTKDPFWEESARAIFVGVAHALMETAKLEEVNIASIYQMIMDGEQKFGAGSTYLAEFINDCLPSDSVAPLLLTSYLKAPSETKSSMRAVFLQGLSLFARSEGLMGMLCHDDLQINKLDGATPTAIYIIIPDERPIFDNLAGVLCSQIMSHYVRMAQDKYNGKLPCRLNVCLEELGNIGGAITSLDHLMSAGRSRNIRCQLVLQSLSQLDQIYGTNKATTIKSNADVMVAYRTNHLETLEELSKKCGERSIHHGNYASKEALITPTQLAAMKTGQALVMISGMTKFITWLPDYTEMFDCSDWEEPKHVVKRNKETVSKIDIKEIVSTVKRAKVEGKTVGEHKQQTSSAANSGGRPNSFDQGAPKIPSFEEFMATRNAQKQEEKEKKEEKPKPKIDVDDLVARIDAKIAELERKEAEEAAKKSDSKKRIRITSLGDRPEKITMILKGNTDIAFSSPTMIASKLPFVVTVNKDVMIQNLLDDIKYFGGAAEGVE